MSRFYTLCVLLLLSRFATAAEIFVDNALGRDADDGTLSTARQGNTGPVRTLARAVRLANFGDTIVLANTGQTYYDSLSLMGTRHSGTPYRPFTIVGNGATISGLRAVPPEGWRKERDQIWKLTTTRKGYYQLLRDGKLLTEYVPESSINPLENLTPGQWVNWKGSVYYRQTGIETPDYQDFAFTADQTGISLHQVQNVLIVDVVLQHFRFDGVHAQGMCNGIELHNVTVLENGRAGVAASGASTIDIYGGAIERNGRFQTLNLDRSKVSLHEAVYEE